MYEVDPHLVQTITRFNITGTPRTSTKLIWEIIYIAFIFEGARFEAVLECAEVGNALYLLKGNWTELSKLSKRELKGHPNARRIIHDDTGRWFFQLQAMLRTRDQGDY